MRTKTSVIYPTEVVISDDILEMVETLKGQDNSRIIPAICGIRLLVMRLFLVTVGPHGEMSSVKTPPNCLSQRGHTEDTS